MSRTLLAALVAALVAGGPARIQARAAGPDPVLGALRTADVFVGPGVTPDAADATAELAEAARQARDDGAPVKFAIVPGPVGSPSTLAYARSLRQSLRFDGNVIVVAPGRPVAVAGAATAAATTKALRRARVGRITASVPLALAAEKATRPAATPSKRGVGTRGVLGLIGLALIGALWAAAIGLRRGHAAERARLHGVRTLVAEALDDLERRIEALAEPGGPAARREIDAAAAEYAAAREEFGQARDLQTLIDTGGRVRRGLAAAHRAGAPAADELDARLAAAGVLATPDR